MTNMTDVTGARKKSIARIHQLSPYELMLKSWQLAFDLRDVQQGQVSRQAWGGVCEGEEFGSYMERYRDLQHKLRVCKSLVSCLFDQPFTIRGCLNPSAGYKKKNTNPKKKKSRRAVELSQVRDLKKRSLDNNEGEEEEDGELSQGQGGLNSKRSRGSDTQTVDSAEANEMHSGGAIGFEFLKEKDFEMDLTYEGDV